MFKRILIPLDLTDKHQRVLEIAAELAQQNGGAVTLLHVIEEIPGLSSDEVDDFYSRLEQRAKEHLQNCGNHFTSKNIPWQSEVRIGSRIHEINRFASEMNADLVLVTAPNIDPNRPGTGWASLSWKIGLVANCPVMLVR